MFAGGWGRSVETVLVANRGEIACRVIRACHALGLRAVAVYGPGEQDALHVTRADAAFRLPTDAPVPYLDIPALMAVARRAGATLLHPGYGFLSENPGLAAACAEAGIAFVGPSADVIRAMGDKIAARQIAVAAGVPVVPGTPAVTDADAARAWAAAHGYPVAVKAAGGGGGRGFRVVQTPAEMADALTGAAREGARSFGNAAVYLERYFDAPRHIEVQILADAHGTVLHLGERDCSVQRRHQKLIEEAPAPHLAPAMRTAITEAAVRLARAVGYVGAGTVEFIAQGDAVSFLEMNTRVQVEHPVTEMVTGVDIVQWQLRIACGEPLTLAQADIALTGHAIECRMLAEDPARGFQPLPGLLTRYVEPMGAGVRVDGGYRAGDAIPTAYDSLIAKLIVYAESRDEAITAMDAALTAYVIEGVPTTIPFHRAALAHPDFRTGSVTTRFIEQSGVLAGCAPQPAPVPAPAPDPGRLVTLELDGERHVARVFGSLAITTQSSASVTPRRPPPRLDRDRVTNGAAGNSVLSPIGGVVVRVATTAGQAIAQGAVVAVVEAMKMENEVRAARDGVIAAMHVSVGDSVQVGTLLATLME